MSEWSIGKGSERLTLLPESSSRGEFGNLVDHIKKRAEKVLSPLPSKRFFFRGFFSSPSLPTRAPSSSQGEGRALGGLLAAFVGFVAALVLRQFIAEKGQCEQRLKVCKRLEKDLREGEGEKDARIFTVLSAEEKLTSYQLNQKTVQVALASSLLAFAALALVGALFSIPSLLTVGGILGIASAGGLLTQWGCDSLGKRDKMLAKELLDATEKMTSPSSA